MGVAGETSWLAPGLKLQICTESPGYVQLCSGYGRKQATWANIVIITNSNGRLGCTRYTMLLESQAKYKRNQMTG